ncbi:acyl-CoA thioesterase [Parapedomonas caeni]
MSDRNAGAGVGAFDRATALTPDGADGWVGHTDKSYWNMLGPYGGWSAALLLKAVLNDPRARGAPISATVSFCGAIADGPFRIRTRLVRRNRSTDFWAAELCQGAAEGGGEGAGEQVCGQILVTMAERRETAGFTQGERPSCRLPEELAPVRGGSGFPWFERYDIRWAAGRPFKGTGDTRSLTWVRDVEARPLDHPLLLSICDTVLPRVFFHQQTPSPIATVTLNAYFHATPEEIHAVAGDWLLLSATGRRAHQGFFDHQATLWSRDGTLIATTEQLAWYRSAETA